jgi:hypothetical protein
MPTLTKDGHSITTAVPREIVRLRSQGFREAPATEEALAELNVDDLRKELAARQLPVSGKKPDLVTRLAGAEQPGTPGGSAGTVTS